MKPIVRSLIAVVVSFIRSRVALQVEIVALRHQLTVYQRSIRRPAIGQELRTLIRDISIANPRWGAPRILGELRKLGIAVAKSTIDKYRVRPRRPSSRRGGCS